MTLSPHRTHFGVSGVKAASINCALTHTHMRTHTTLTKWIGNNHKIIHKHMHAHKMHTWCLSPPPCLSPDLQQRQPNKHTQRHKHKHRQIHTCQDTGKDAHKMSAWNELTQCTGAMRQAIKCSIFRTKKPPPTHWYPHQRQWNDKTHMHTLRYTYTVNLHHVKIHILKSACGMCMCGTQTQPHRHSEKTNQSNLQ